MKNIKTELLVATRNKKKLQEIRELLRGLPVIVTSLADYPGLPVIDECGKTFAENAVIKACVIAMATKRFVLGEDSGLEVDALSRRPGVYSARYSGPSASDRKNNLKLLRELKGVVLKKRTARYRCAVALAGPAGLMGVVEGRCQGVIALRPRGKNGFGYDPLFLIPRWGRTFGELAPEIKHRMSHRFKALQKARCLIQRYAVL